MTGLQCLGGSARLCIAAVGLAISACRPDHVLAGTCFVDKPQRVISLDEQEVNQASRHWVGASEVSPRVWIKIIQQRRFKDYGREAC
jgi:hypothetical protein